MGNKWWNEVGAKPHAQEGKEMYKGGKYKKKEKQQEASEKGVSKETVGGTVSRCNLYVHK